MSTLISNVIAQRRMACMYPLTSKTPVLSSRNFVRLMLARLHAVSSKNMNSLHGLLAFIFPSLGHVCHSLIVSSYCTPGSAHAHAQYPISSQSCFALIVFAIFLSVLLTNPQSPFLLSASRKALGILILLLLFCPLTVR